ncbi:GAF domain-containing sensor histidine kinase [Sphingomonas sp.]|uniref:sensor histidine kinase n=1 Tax=Sphingomonas sp. TaxID=28214 RepID=UPI0028B0FB0E|nr:GAF domain-containing sensor histidine kinase [Sphingomonas sp.]
MLNRRSALFRPSDQAPGAGSEDAPSYRFLELLAVSASDLLQAEDLAPALDRIFGLIRSEVELDVFFHYAFDGNGLDLDAWAGITPDQVADWSHVPIGIAICGGVAESLTPMIARDIQRSDDPRLSYARGMGLDACFCTPLLHNNVLLGTLAFGRRGVATFTDAEIQFLQTLASYVTLAKHRIGVDRELRARLQERDRMLAERVTIERQMLELTRASALGSIAATVAHELNQPLSAAANYMAALRLSSASDDRTRDLTGAAEQQLQRAGEIIRRIRRMVHQNDLVLEDRSITGCIEEALNLVRAAAPLLMPPVTIHVAGEANLGRFDNVQIVQVLANLLRNAGEACQQHADAAIRVTAERQDPLAVTIRVIDNGPGVPPDRRHLLFQPGLGNGRGESGGGLGLGLAISHHLIEGHGGRIWTEQTPGGGATFAFTIPAIREAVAEA